MLSQIESNSPKGHVTRKGAITMAGYYTESNYENAVLQLLNEGLGYNYVYGPDVERLPLSTLRGCSFALIAAHQSRFAAGCNQ